MKLSLCITCWSGDAHLLDRCLQEFTKQTVAPDEIIISSSNLNKSPCEISSIKIADKIVPIKKVNRAQRGLHGFPRNQGADNCSSDFIMFFDVDDIPHPDKIDTTLKIVSSNPTCDAFLHNYYLDATTFQQFSTIPVEKIIQKDSQSTNLIASDGIHHGHLTIRPEIVRKIRYNENRTLGEDGEFCQSVFDSGYTILYCPHKLLCYVTEK